MLTQHQYQRYNRQILLPELGIAGQQKLLNARVLVIGAGGLGCGMLPYLAAAGIGTIGICDDDTVQLHNLHRQVLYNTSQVGQQKATCAAVFLQALNPGINVISLPERLTNKNALRLFDQYDIIADGTDNFATRYLINDACVLLNKPLIYGAIAMFEAQVAVFNLPLFSGENSCNYRDIFPQPPAENEIPNCAEAGVIGVLPAITGSMQANEIIKLITGIGELLVDKLLVYNALNNSCYKFSISKNLAAVNSMPANKKIFSSFDYETACSTGNNSDEITADELANFAAGTYQLVDVRNIGEMPEIDFAGGIKIPLAELQTKATTLTAPIIVTVCQTGARSKKAVEILNTILDGNTTIKRLRGGILEWLKQAKYDEQKT